MVRARLLAGAPFEVVILTRARDDWRTLVSALSAMLRRYDGASAVHSTRVGRLSGRIGKAMGFAGDDLSILQWAGALHDVGKVAIAEETLSKEGPLDADEWTAMKRHPTVGADILMGISPRLLTVARAIRTHHERWDGTGYPAGLTDSQIPSFGRIVAVADAIDAMTSARAHHRGGRPLSTEQVLSELRTWSGRQFDPDVAEVAVTLLNHTQLRSP